MAIGSFRDKRLEEFYVSGSSRRIGRNFHRRLKMLLDVLDAVTDIQDLRGVADFHALVGDRKGEYSMHVSGNWVITFRFVDGEADDINFEDYH